MGTSSALDFTITNGKSLFITPFHTEEKDGKYHERIRTVHGVVTAC